MLLALTVEGVLFFAFLVIKPKWGLVLIILARPLLDNFFNHVRTASGGQGMGFGAIFKLAVIVLAVFLCFYYSAFPRRNKVVRCWFIFLFFMFLSACYSPYRSDALRLFLDYVTYFSMFIIPFLVIKTKEDFLFWLKIYACSFVLPVLCGNWDLLHGGHYTVDAGKRVEGTFSHPNIMAFYLVLGITSYFYILKSKYWKLKPETVWCMRILMANMLVLLVMTKTRNAWIACLVGFVVYGALKDRKFLIILLLVLPLSLAVPQVQDRILTILQGKQNQTIMRV